MRSQGPRRAVDCMQTVLLSQTRSLTLASRLSQMIPGVGHLALIVALPSTPHALRFTPGKTPSPDPSSPWRVGRGGRPLPG
jgi:hypothetical protein